MSMSSIDRSFPRGGTIALFIHQGGASLVKSGLVFKGEMSDV
jgi:hypothetical protein